MYLFFFMFAALLGSFSAFGETPPSGSVRIDDFQYNGPGCAPGTVAANLAPDGEALTLIFADFVAASDKNASGRDSTSCRLNLKLTNPANYQYALFRVDHRGFADLSEGVKGATSVSMKFSESQLAVLGGIDLVGPYNNDYQHAAEIPLTKATWSTCGRDNLVIDTVISVDASSQPATQEIELKSLRNQNQHVDLGRPVKAMQLLAQNRNSYTTCREGHSYLFKGSTVYAVRGCWGKFKVTFADGAGESGFGMMTVDSLDGYLKQQYRLAWRQCR